MKIVPKGSKLIDLRKKHFYCSFLGFWCFRMIVILTQWKMKITHFFGNVHVRVASMIFFKRNKVTFNMLNAHSTREH